MPRFMGYNPNFQYYNPYQRPNFYPNYGPYTPQPKKQPQQPLSEPLPKTTQPQKKPETADTVWLDLILSLLFFLYKEEVKDEGLFLALVLLLIS